MRRLIICFLVYTPLFAIDVTIDANKDRIPISPYVYGKNNSISDNSSEPISNAEWTRIKDSGVTILRESGGNNSTKHNWQKKLTSAPDWYNNVYASDWDYEAQE